MLTWTADKPTVEGWYWMRWPYIRDSTSIKLITKGEDGIMRCGGSDWFGIGRQWAGPIVEPVEREGVKT
jgi:hypothetical protein